MAIAALLLLGVLLGGVGLRFLAGLVETCLEAMQQIQLDFSSHVELPPPRPDLQRPGAPVLLFLHETSASGNSYSKYVGFLEELGVRVRAPDTPVTDLSKVTQALTIFPVPEQLEASREALRAAAAETNGAPLFVFGVSRGASLALLALEAEPEVEVAGVCLDGLFSTHDVLEAMIQRFAPIYLGAMGRWIPRWLRRLTAWMGLRRVQARLGIRFLDSRLALPRVRVPMLLLHGARDRTAPTEFLPEYAATAGARLVLFLKARHNQACVKDPELYRRSVLEFMASCGVPLEAETAAGVATGGGAG